MAIEKINIEQFLKLANDNPVFDVRSPLEFSHAHIPGAYGLPLFSDEERKIIGTIYKQQSRKQAIKIGLDYFGKRMRTLVEYVEEIIINRQNKTNANTSNYILIHCWRGGMRGAAVAWLLDLYGYKVYLLSGGYKAFRNWVLQQFDKPYKFRILGGYTGSGKTKLLRELKNKGHGVIDLEKLANHKGSAFGGLNEKAQPSQEMFENLLSINLYKSNLKLQGTGQKELGSDIANFNKDLNAIWLEDESQRIGVINIPKDIWEQMRNSPIDFIDIPFNERLKYLIETYGIFAKQELANAIIRIRKRLGGLETKNAITALLEDNLLECFSILLKYYDKLYDKALNNRKNLDTLLNKIACTTVSASNAETLCFLSNHQK